MYGIRQARNPVRDLKRGRGINSSNSMVKGEDFQFKVLDNLDALEAYRRRYLSKRTRHLGAGYVSLLKDNIMDSQEGRVTFSTFLRVSDIALHMLCHNGRKIMECVPYVRFWTD